MKIALLGSQSPVKLSVCKQVFTSAPGHEIISYAAASGVNEQPFNEETMRGACNRINAARNIIPQADYYVSIENGIFEEDGKYIDRGILVIETKEGDRIIAKSEGVEFPARYVEETRQRKGGFKKWTVGKIMAEHGVVKNHEDPHKDLDTKGRSREDFLMQAATEAVIKLRQLKNPEPKILHGICGIGNGHTFRQLPIIEHFAKSARMVLFTYGNSHDFYSRKFAGHQNVKVLEVANPFYSGNAEGLDFETSAALAVNQDVDYFRTNAESMAQVKEHLGGHPDLVISDYEMAAAQYAYSCNAPLVTFDQQSKYLVGEFPQPLQGEYVEDEIQRLRLFFPKAEKRLAATFFKVTQKPDAQENVVLCPPVMGNSITSLIRKPANDRKSIVVYISSQKPLGQSLDEIIEVCESQPGVSFHIFSKGLKSDKTLPESTNVHLYEQDNQAFHERLAECDGIVSTAGHTLLSEAMYLGIPVYAMPLPLYEQQMNAHIIAQNGFGLAASKLEEASLKDFIEKIPAYAEAIKADKTVLLRQDGRDEIIRQLNMQLVHAAL